MTSLERAALRDDLVDDEGISLTAYSDSMSYLTIGVGRLVDPRKKGSGLTVPEAMFLLDNDINACLEDLGTFPWFEGLDTVRQCAMINMRFQLGSGGLREFHHLLDALSRHAYAEAAEHGRDSKWAKLDTPARAARVLARLETGVM